MDPIVRHMEHDRVTAARSADAVSHYIERHLRNTAEGSEPIRYVDGYLTREHQVEIRFLNLDAWLAAGLTPSEFQEGRIPAAMIRHLQMGMHRDGVTRLLPKRLPVPKPVDELLCTVPAEISHAIEAGKIDRDTYVDLVIEEVRRQLGLKPTRVSRGGREDKQRWTYVEGKTLSLAVYHSRNQGQEPHSHIHILTFAPVLLSDRSWRSFGMKGHLDVLHKEGGRGRLTKLLTGMMERQGIQVEWKGGRAKDQIGTDFGPRLQFPGEAAVESGQVAHSRGGIFRAMRELYRQVSVTLPEAEDMELLRRSVPKKIRREKSDAEQSVWAVMAYARKVLRWPKRNLPELPGLSFELLDQACAQAQWWLRYGWPGPAGEWAAEYLTPLREALAAEVEGEVQAEHDELARSSGAAQVVGILEELNAVGDRKGIAPSAVKYALQRRGLILKKSANYLHDILDTGARTYGLSLGEAEANRIGGALGGGHLPVPWLARMETGADDLGPGCHDPEGFRIGSWSGDSGGDEDSWEGTGSGDLQAADRVLPYLAHRSTDGQRGRDKPGGGIREGNPLASGGTDPGGTSREDEAEGGTGNHRWHPPESGHPVRDPAFQPETTETSEEKNGQRAGDLARPQSETDSVFRPTDARSDSSRASDMGADGDSLRAAEGLDQQSARSQKPLVILHGESGAGSDRILQDDPLSVGAVRRDQSHSGSGGHLPVGGDWLSPGFCEGPRGSRVLPRGHSGPRRIEPHRQQPGKPAVVLHGGLPGLGTPAPWEDWYWRRRLAAARVHGGAPWAVASQQPSRTTNPEVPASSGFGAPLESPRRPRR